MIIVHVLDPGGINFVTNSRVLILRSVLSNAAAISFVHFLGDFSKRIPVEQIRTAVASDLRLCCYWIGLSQRLARIAHQLDGVD